MTQHESMQVMRFQNHNYKLAVNGETSSAPVFELALNHFEIPIKIVYQYLPERQPVPL
jgi:hypothetical protein